MNIYFDFPLIWCLEAITVYAGGNQLCALTEVQQINWWRAETNTLLHLPTEKHQQKIIFTIRINPQYINALTNNCQNPKYSNKFVILHQNQLGPFL